jgi:hypothetical protein
MSEPLRADASLFPARPSPLAEDTEVEEVLAALRLLYQKVSNPVIRECLEAARSDIAYLTSPTDPEGREVRWGGSGSAEFEEEESEGEGLE